MGIQQNITEVLRAYKKDTGKTMAEMSEELGIAKSSLQGYMTGSTCSSLSTVEYIARKLNIEMQVLADGSFPLDKIKLLVNLMENYALLAELSMEKRHRYAELLMEIVDLWDHEFPA